MQVKLKICSGCNQPKPIWKREGKDLYCQFCWSKIKPQTPLKQSVLPKSQKPIAKHSNKRAKQEAVYSILRKAFLNNHPMCQAKISNECRGLAGEVHHKSGRIGDLLCNDTKFLAVCTPCHQHIENNRQQAIELGFSELRLKNNENE